MNDKTVITSENQNIVTENIIASFLASSTPVHMKISGAWNADHFYLKIDPTHPEFVSEVLYSAHHILWSEPTGNTALPFSKGHANYYETIPLKDARERSKVQQLIEKCIETDLADAAARAKYTKKYADGGNFNTAAKLSLNENVKRYKATPCSIWYLSYDWAIDPPKKDKKKGGKKETSTSASKKTKKTKGNDTSSTTDEV